MTNNNSTTNFIFGASEREFFRPLAEASESRISTLSMAEIIDGLMADYKSFCKGNAAGIKIPDSKLEPRMLHNCILYGEGLRQAPVHIDIAKKFMLASLFDVTVQACYWLNAEQKAQKDGKPFDIIEEIAKFPHYSNRAFAWLKANGEEEHLRMLLNEIQKYEDFKATQRKKELEEKLKGFAK